MPIEEKDPKIESERNLIENYPDVIAFKEYISKHEDNIGEEERMGRIDLSDKIYREFCVRNAEGGKYSDDDQRVQSMTIEFKKEIDEIKKTQYETPSGLNIFEFGGYLNAIINGGPNKQGKMGRIYLNLKPEFAPEFFETAIREFLKSGLHVSLKIDSRGEAKGFNRLDKAVIYFLSNDEVKLLEWLNNYYKENSIKLDNTGVPKFTIPIKDESGEVMTGISFGEEPLSRGTSFGGIRATILADVYRESRWKKQKINDPDFDFAAKFIEKCDQYGVDHNNPAFNNRGKDFDLIRKMNT